MGKKHPLDIFRNSSQGFDSASRERRTVIGRVVASAPRAAAGPGAQAAPGAPAASASATTALPPAVAATRERMLNASPPLGVSPLHSPMSGPAPAAPAPAVSPRIPLNGARPLAPPPIPLVAERKRPEPRPTELLPLRPAGQAGAAPAEKSPAASATVPAAAARPAPARVNRVLLRSAFVLVGGLVLWTTANSFTSPSLKKSAATAPAASQFRVVAAKWPGTPAGHEAAISARTLLLSQGFGDVDVLGWPGATAGSFDHFDLVVGKSGSEDELGQTVSKLKGIKNWPGPVKQPFKDAAIQAAP